jgi:hypothetical protein
MITAAFDTVYPRLNVSGSGLEPSYNAANDDLGSQKLRFSVTRSGQITDNWNEQRVLFSIEIFAKIGFERGDECNSHSTTNPKLSEVALNTHESGSWRSVMKTIS